VIRVVVAAALAVALLAASLPAIEDARIERTATDLDATLSRVERAAADLATNEAPTPGDLAGARRIVDVRLPPPSWTSAPVTWVSLGGRPGGPPADVLAYRIAGRPPDVIDLRGVDLIVPEGPVVLRDAGRHAVALDLLWLDGRAVVRVSRATA
jgi:hypothetical protein